MREQGKSKTGTRRLLAVGALAVVVMVVLALKGSDKNETVEPVAAPAPAVVPAALPRLVDLGADKCVPCKMMAPILDQLRVDYEGRLRVDFIDVWKSPAAGEPSGIKLIPTQVFLAPDGRELFRHEGFISREDILAKWRELGYSL